MRPWEPTAREASQEAVRFPEVGELALPAGLGAEARRADSWVLGHADGRQASGWGADNRFL